MSKGVDSVRSPVANVSSAFRNAPVSFEIQDVIAGVMDEFARLYGTCSDAVRRAQRAHIVEDSELYAGEDWVAGTVGEEQGYGEAEIVKGIEEMKVSCVVHFLALEIRVSHANEISSPSSGNTARHPGSSSRPIR